MDEAPVVDDRDRDRGQVEGDVVRVVGVAIELGQVLGQSHVRRSARRAPDVVE
ncbi:hypothetical protein [Pseudonocardia yunnanensis]|uniref:Uncharacterized protein n=1 Tax=Pseudonocardia yunnanensis TaxID=58107 RepID=A0ABW4F873_9PSEU